MKRKEQARKSTVCLAEVQDMHKVSRSVVDTTRLYECQTDLTPYFSPAFREVAFSVRIAATARRRSPTGILQRLL